MRSGNARQRIIQFGNKSVILNRLFKLFQTRLVAGACEGFEKMSRFGRQRRSSLAPRAGWVIEGGHHHGCGRCARPRREPVTAAAPSSQALAGSLQPWRSCAIMLSYAGACGRAGKRFAGEMGGDEKDIAPARSSSSAAWSDGFCRRSKFCNGGAAQRH